MEQVPEIYRDHPQFLRYFEIWRRDEASIVFVPLAEILRQGGFLSEACEVCEVGLKHNPDSVSGRLILASVYWAQGQKDAADRMAREILQRMPDHPEAQKYLLNGKSEEEEGGKSKVGFDTQTMANILADQGEYEEAAKIVRGLVKEDPDNQTLQKSLQELEEHLGCE